MTKGQCHDCGRVGDCHALGKHRDLVCPHCYTLRERFALDGERPESPDALFAGEPEERTVAGKVGDIAWTWRAYRVACREVGYTLPLTRSLDEYQRLHARWSDYLRWGALALGVDAPAVEDDTWVKARSTLSTVEATVLRYIMGVEA